MCRCVEDHLICFTEEAKAARSGIRTRSWAEAWTKYDISFEWYQNKPVYSWVWRCRRSAPKSIQTLASPRYETERKWRGKKWGKCWLCLFFCFFFGIFLLNRAKRDEEALWTALRVNDDQKQVHFKEACRHSCPRRHARERAPACYRRLQVCFRSFLIHWLMVSCDRALKRQKYGEHTLWLITCLYVCAFSLFPPLSQLNIHQ